MFLFFDKNVSFLMFFQRKTSKNLVKNAVFSDPVGGYWRCVFIKYIYRILRLIYQILYSYKTLITAPFSSINSTGNGSFLYLSIFTNGILHSLILTSFTRIVPI